MKAARVSVPGELGEPVVVPTPAADGPDAVVAALRWLVLELGGADAAAVGVVVPGSVSDGVARYSANLGWRDVPLAALIEQDVHVPVVVEHDVRAAGFAERELGLARGVDDSLVVVIGTGIAGVIVSGGSPVRGAISLAGEVGHVPVYPDGDVCACGQQGCLETYASAAAIGRRYRARTGRPATAADVAAGLGQDPAADAVWAEATTALAIAMTTCTMLLDPGVIVLAGGLAAAGAALCDPVAAGLAGRLTWRPAPPVAVSPLAGRAGLHGAALLAARAAG
jgi:glucokinase